MKNSEKTMEKIVALCKGRGFVFPGSEIYGGLANTWDYGPLGVELKNNVKKAWWKKFVQENPYNVGLDAAILMNPQVWVASGHVGGFSDPLMDCKECKERFRADKVIEDWCQENNFDLGHSVDAMSQEEYRAAACAAVKKLSQDVGIPADLKETYLKLFETDFANTRKILGSMPARQSLRGKIADGGEGESLAKMTWDEIDRSGRLSELKEKYPDLYERKYKEMCSTLNIQNS